MKVWKATRVLVTYRDGTVRLTDELNKLEADGFIIEGTDIYGPERDRVMIIASREVEEEGGVFTREERERVIKCTNCKKFKFRSYSNPYLCVICVQLAEQEGPDASI